MENVCVSRKENMVIEKKTKKSKYVAHHIQYFNHTHNRIIYSIIYDHFIIKQKKKNI